MKKSRNNTKRNKKMRYQDDIFSMGGSHWSEAQVDGKAGIKPSTSLRSVAATQTQYLLRIAISSGWHAQTSLSMCLARLIVPGGIHRRWMEI